MDNSIVENCWKSYQSMVIHKNAGEVQIKESRKAFYAGAWTIFTAFIAASETSDEAAHDFLDVLHNELNLYVEELGITADYFLKTMQ